MKNHFFNLSLCTRDINLLEEEKISFSSPANEGEPKWGVWHHKSGRKDIFFSISDFYLIILLFES